MYINMRFKGLSNNYGLCYIIDEFLLYNHNKFVTYVFKNSAKDVREVM